MDEPSPFEIRETREGAGVRLKVLGELDLATAPELTERLAQLRDDSVPVTIDLAELSFMDSSGLAALVGAVRHAAGDGWRLTVLPDLSGQVRQLFDLTGAREILGEHTGPNSNP